VTLALVALVTAALPVCAQTNSADATPPIGPFLGQSSCSSSGCHGGAGEKRGTLIRFNKLDYHTRSAATLNLARSKVIANVLNIDDPPTSKTCTVCHEPFQPLATDAALVKALDPANGVSCENCHGPGEKWLLTHTRDDLTHADRVHAGMRDLQNLYVRANSCVACHQNVSADLLQAGHPELIFELDGQSVTEPKHWREQPNWSGPQTWLVGQAVALRESAWQLTQEKSPTEKALNRASALLWLVQTASKINDVFPAASGLPTGLTADSADGAQKWSDEFARAAAAAPWPADATRKCLDLLAGTASNFRETSIPQAAQARRAERLVLALDRLVAGLNDDAACKRLNSPLNQLFHDAQSLPDFDPQKFAAHLDEFQTALAASK